MQVTREWTTKAGLRAITIIPGRGIPCGYVHIEKDHPLHGVYYRDETETGDSPEMIFEVHGGLTFSGNDHPEATDGWWFGFDCGHAGDATPIGLGEGKQWSTDEVAAECESLAQQLSNYAENAKLIERMEP